MLKRLSMRDYPAQSPICDLSLLRSPSTPRIQASISLWNTVPTPTRMLTAKTRKRPGVVGVETAALPVTPVPETTEIVLVPVLDPATPEDIDSMPDAKCAPESREGVLPIVEEVIPDTSMHRKFPPIEIFDLGWLYLSDSGSESEDED
ncbi:hypothetical protein B0H13DRAFT_2648581 [Mycena leptocephala]|nr:hypothetical protein B0H13DRAFT_2648581 [Mycena leptocephala]